MGRSWDDVLELGGVRVKSSAGSKASLGTLSGEPHMGASEMSLTWARGPGSKGPCFSVSPKDTGKTLACGSTPGVWGQDVPQGPPQRTLPMAEGGDSRQRWVRGCEAGGGCGRDLKCFKPVLN